MKRALAMLVAACGAAPPPASKPCIDVAVTPPSQADRTAGNVARLHGSFAGDGMGVRSNWVCLGDGRRMHDQFSVEIRASAHELQRIAIDGVPLLIHVPPGGDLAVSYHPCAHWQIWEDALDSGTVADGIVARRGERCPAGYVDGGEIQEANDPHCANATGECPYVRCVRGATLALAAAAARPIQLVDDDGTPHETIAPGASLLTDPYGGFCPEFESIVTGTDRVRIAPGLGERWQLTVDAYGRVRGWVAGGY